MPEHHPAIAACHSPSPSPREALPGSEVDFLGITTRTEFTAQVAEQVAGEAAVRSVPSLPGFNEEYFEWTDLFEAVEEADAEFVMAELGAGFGRWLVRGARVAGRRNLRFRALAVEAEPTHFGWLRQHCHDNGLSNDEVEALWAAVNAQPGFVPFRVGKAGTDYGQGVKRYASAPYPDAPTRRRLKARSSLGRPPRTDPEVVTDLWVPSLTVAEVLSPYARVDLVDIDVQGLELTILTASMASLDDRVRRIHVGTHSSEIETELRALFKDHGWQPLHDYGCHSRTDTVYGVIDFGDGVQTWLNPRLDPATVARQASGPRATPAASLSLVGHVNALTHQVRSLEHDNAKLRRKIEALRAKLADVRDRYQRAKALARPDRIG